jgi:hypothetical protein
VAPGARKRSLWPPGAWLLVAGLVVAGLVVGLLASRLIPTHHAAAPTAGSSTLPPTSGSTAPGTLAPPAAAPSDPAAAALSALVLHQADVAANLTVAAIPGGTRVTGAATLDLCNGTFPSERLRTARLQVATVDAHGNGTLSTEAVLYSTPAGTAQAFSELKSVAAKCPASPVVSPVGEPTVTTRFNPAPDRSWPQVATVERLAFDFVSTDQSGQAQHATAVYLRRGRVLMGVYFARPDGPQSAVDGQTTIAGVVNVFATRMARLPASTVTGR